MLNPNEQFVVMAFSRKHIADLFNEVIDYKGLNINPFTPDDDRLTAGVCQEIASGWVFVLEDTDEDERFDAGEALFTDVLNKLVDL